MNAIKIIGDRAIALLTEAVYNPGSVKAGAVDFLSAQWNQVSAPVDPAPVPLQEDGGHLSRLLDYLADEVDYEKNEHLNAAKIARDLFQKMSAVTSPDEDGELVERMAEQIYWIDVGDDLPGGWLVADREYYRGEAVKLISLVLNSKSVASLRLEITRLTEERNAWELEVQRQKAYHDQSHDNIVRLCEERDALRESVASLTADNESAHRMVSKALNELDLLRGERDALRNALNEYPDFKFSAYYAGNLVITMNETPVGHVLKEPEARKILQWLESAWKEITRALTPNPTKEA